VDFARSANAAALARYILLSVMAQQPCRRKRTAGL
jgi:hypothetical protein